jgi:hypothetical protein
MIKVSNKENGKSLVLHLVYRLQNLTKTRGWHNINLIFTNI